MLFNLNKILKIFRRKYLLHAGLLDWSVFYRLGNYPLATCSRLDIGNFPSKVCCRTEIFSICLQNMRRTGRHKFLRISVFFLVYAVIHIASVRSEKKNVDIKPPESTVLPESTTLESSTAASETITSKVNHFREICAFEKFTCFGHKADAKRFENARIHGEHSFYGRTLRALQG